VLDSGQSAQGLELVLTCSHNLNLSPQLKDFARKAWISQREVGGSQEDVGKQYELSRTSDQRGREWRPFIEFLKKQSIGLSDQTNPPYRLDWLGDPQLVRGTLYRKLSNFVI
jgi:hypothetical protein